MCRKLSFVGVIAFLLFAIAVTPIPVRAEGDPPPTPAPIKPPWITGVNPNATLSSSKEEEIALSGLAESWQDLVVPLLAAPPSYVDLAPQLAGDSLLSVVSLAVPQYYQDPSAVTCGAAALGMALEFLSLNGEGQAPSQDILVSDLNNSGLLYKTGTGVEELAYLARGHGYRGTTAFHNWTLEQLAEQLRLGKPVVVSLGSDGESQPGHFVTLTGISTDGKWVSYNDPILGAQTVAASDFLKAWNQQGNSGLTVQKQPLSMADDPLLPWMGLFSAITMLAVMAKHYPLNEEIKGILAGIRGVLSNPRRKGLGGKLVDHSGGGGNSSSPPYIAPPGYEWDKTVVPRYGWKKVDIVEEVEVPNMVRTWAIVKVNRWIEKKPVYKTVTMDRGRWSYRIVTKYRTERYRTKQRYQVKKSYWYRRNGRLRRGSYSVWKTRTVVKTRRVPYTKREKTWVPKIVREKRLVRTDEIEHRDPVYGWRMEKHGTKTVERTRSVDAWKPVGTEIEWDLKKKPKPTPTPTPPPPTPTPPNPTPTFTPVNPSITPEPTTTIYPTNTQVYVSTTEPSPTFTATPSATIDPTKLAYWKDEQKLEKNTFDYIRQTCGVIDPIPLDARTGTTIDNDFLLKEASLYCVAAFTGIGQLELIPVCSLIPASGIACHIYNLGFDFHKSEGFYFDNLYRNLTPVPTSANPTKTPTITSTSTPLPTPTPIPTITLTPSTTSEE